jgi:hypothetical protein
MNDEYVDIPPSNNAQVPKWLLVTYLVLPIWGLIALYIFWNGSVGWLDRGYWHQLQRAANTTFPYVNQDSPGAQAKSSNPGDSLTPETQKGR